MAFDEARQDASWGTDLVLGEEARRRTSLRMARYHQALPLPQHLLFDSRGWRPHPEVGPLQGGPPQALSHVGGPIQDRQRLQASISASSTRDTLT